MEFKADFCVMNNTYFRGQIFKYLGHTPKAVIKQRQRHKKIIKQLNLNNRICWWKCGYAKKNGWAKSHFWSINNFYPEFQAKQHRLKL